jgi:hypothetical protein
LDKNNSFHLLLTKLTKNKNEVPKMLQRGNLQSDWPKAMLIRNESLKENAMHMARKAMQSIAKWPEKLCRA